MKKYTIQMFGVSKIFYVFILLDILFRLGCFALIGPALHIQLIFNKYAFNGKG